VAAIIQQKLAFFNDGLDTFEEIDTIADGGSRPRFNEKQLCVCHAQPQSEAPGAAVNPQFTVISSGVAAAPQYPSGIHYS